MSARQAEPARAIVRRTGAALGPLLLAVGVCASLGGCAGFWDDVTSREFHFKDMFKASPPPLEVLRTSHDGDRRSKALRALREPLQHGGTQKEQDEVLQALTWSALSDPQPLCRMAAVDSLQHFKDRRAAQALVDAYYRADYFQRDRPETMAVLRCQALTALGINGNPLALDLLTGIVKQLPTAGANKDQQQVMDERIAAARSLANFPQYQSAEALVEVLRTENSSVALRNRATESLRDLTGEDLPPNAQAWADFLHKSGSRDGLARKRTLTDKLLQLVSFSSEKPQPPAGDAPKTPPPTAPKNPPAGSANPSPNSKGTSN